MKQFLKHKLFAFLLFFVILLLSSIIYTVYLLISNNNFITADELAFSIKNYRVVTYFIGLFLFFVLGFTSGMLEKKRGILVGTTSAFLLLLVIIIIKLFSKNLNIEIYQIIKYLSYLLMGAVGGIISVNLRSYKR